MLLATSQALYEGCPAFWGTVVGVTINKDYSTLESLVGSPSLGNYHII